MRTVQLCIAVGAVAWDCTRSCGHRLRVLCHIHIIIMIIIIVIISIIVITSPLEGDGQLRQSGGGHRY